MALADLATTTERPAPAPRCAVCVALALLPEADRDDLEKALHNPYAAPRLIAAELTLIGHTVRAFTVNRHIRGECAAGEVYR